MVSCQKDPTRHAYAWQIGPFWQDTFEIWVSIDLGSWLIAPENQAITWTNVDFWLVSFCAIHIRAISLQMA